jgi:hypothetical protein
VIWRDHDRPDHQPDHLAPSPVLMLLTLVDVVGVAWPRRRAIIASIAKIAT